jgi:hypothetical protein
VGGECLEIDGDVVLWDSTMKKLADGRIYFGEERIEK